MEAGDSAADLGGALMFDFDFDNHEGGLVDQNHQSQTHPTDDDQQYTTSMNFSHEENVEKGSSSDHLTVTTTADTNSEDLDSSLENTTNLAPQEPSSVNPDRIMGTETAYNPNTETSEFRLPAKENNQPQRHVNLENPNSANVLSGHAHFSPEGSNQQQLLASAPNNPAPTITSSFNTPFLGAATPSYFPTREPMELGSSSGSNQSFLYNSNSNQQAQNLVGSTYNSISLGYIDTSLGNGANLQQNQCSFLQSPLSETPQQYPLTTVEMMPQFGGLSSFNPERAINFNDSNQFSSGSENSFQNELLRLQGMDSFNLPTSLRTDHQLAENVNNNEFLNNQQPALPYQNSFPQTSIALGINSQAAQAPRNWFFNQNALYTPLTPSKPQVNQFLAPNVFDPQSANTMSIGSSVPLRSEHSANNQQQLFNAVPVPAENVLNPRSQCSMIAEQSMFPRLQNLQSQSNQVLPLTPNYNVQEPQGATNLLPAPSLPLNISIRTPQFPLYQQLNPSAGAPDSFNLQPANSIQLKNSLLSGSRTTQQSSNNHAPLTLGQMMNPQRDNSFLLSSSIPPRSRTFDLQGLLHQTTKPSFTFPIPPASSQLSSVLNSATDLFGGHNPREATPTASTFPQLELSLNRNEQSILGSRSPSTSPFELAEASSSSSSSSKRPRMSNFPYKDFIMKDNASTVSQSRENEGEKLSLLTNPSNNNIARPGKNTLYDPLFEGLGLPIDPHLRLFNSNS